VKRRFLVDALVTAFAALWIAQPLLAADTCAAPPDSPNVLGQIELARAAGCYGDDKDTNPLTARVLKIANEESCKRPSKTLRSDLADASRAVEDEGASLAVDSTSDWEGLTGALRRELNRSTGELRDLEAIANPSYWEWSENDATLQQGQGNLFLISYAPIVQKHCAPDRQGCAAAIATAVRVNRVVNLTHRLHQCAASERVTGVHKRLTELDAEWDAYFFKTRSQYVWELAVNSARFTGKDNVFAEPPKDQVILVHPGVAYEYVGGGVRHDKSYELTVIAEVLGYNRFGWSNAGDGSRSKWPALGASIVATYSPDNMGQHVGYGLMLHAYNAYSLGVTRRDTGAGKDTTYLLSVDLMRFLLSPSAAAMQAFRGAGTPAVSAGGK
jgi:hypothetical protein